MANVISKTPIYLVVATAGATGVETVVYNLARLLSANSDFEPIVISFESGYLIDRLKDAEISCEVIRIRTPFDFSGIYRLIKYLASRSGVLHSHGARALLASSLASLFLNLPHVTTVHQYPTPSRSRIKDFIFHLIEKLLLSTLCNYVIFVSQSIRLHYQAILPKKVYSTVIYNCTDDVYRNLNLESINEYRRFNRSAICTAPGAHIIGCVGRLHYIKGQEFLIRAFDIIKKRFRSENVYVLFIGSGPDEMRLKQLAASFDLGLHVQFVGAINNLYEWYPAIDTLVLPSLSESFGLVAVEGASFGIDIVASDCPALVEVLEGYKYKVFFEAGNFIDLADKLSLCLSSSSRLRFHRLSDAKRFGGKYSSETFLMSHRVIYLSLSLINNRQKLDI